MSGINMIRKNICFPHNILEETKKISKEMNINFSYLVREATKEYIEKVKMEILKKELIEQGKDTAKLNLKICDDFKYADGENI
jgi:DNA-directed RNA polymerase specialized sigma subunit